MLLPMNLTHLGYMFVHQVFSSDIERAGKVVDLLVSLQTLINYVFDGANVPDDTGLLFKHFFVYYA